MLLILGVNFKELVKGWIFVPKHQSDKIRSLLAILDQYKLYHTCSQFSKKIGVIDGLLSSGIEITSNKQDLRTFGYRWLC